MKYYQLDDAGRVVRKTRAEAERYELQHAKQENQYRWNENYNDPR